MSLKLAPGGQEGKSLPSHFFRTAIVKHTSVSRAADKLSVWDVWAIRPGFMSTVVRTLVDTGSTVSLLRCRLLGPSAWACQQKLALLGKFGVAKLLALAGCRDAIAGRTQEAVLPVEVTH